MAKGTQDTNNNKINTFNKGLNKDFDASFIDEGMWTHARNAVNNTIEGDISTISNEASNVLCIEAGKLLPGVSKYIIGVIHLFSDKWIIFTVSYNALDKPFWSEIGLFDEDTCTYRIILQDRKCFGFNKYHLITGSSRLRDDCSWGVYWADGLNPDRYLNVGDPQLWLDPDVWTWQGSNSPTTINWYVNAVGDRILWPGVQWEQSCTVTNGNCNICENTNVVDCAATRLARLVRTPCVSLQLAEEGGTLQNGSYYVQVAYTIKNNRVTNYFSPSNVQPIYSERDREGALLVKIEADQEYFDEFELVIVRIIDEQSSIKQFGYFSTRLTEIYIDFIQETLPTKTALELREQNPVYEKSDQMTDVNTYLLRIGPTSKFDFNYQPLANLIKTEWVSVEYPEDYYIRGGSNTSYLRDEVYCFFIRWVYDTGDKSAAYHIPGRGPRNFKIPGTTTTLFETAPFTNADSLPGDDQVFETFNTASITGTPNTVLPDGGIFRAYGDMAYWQSSLQYPDNKEEVWNSSANCWTGVPLPDPTQPVPYYDLCGQYIRHHKFPDNELSPHFKTNLGINNSIILMGVRFSNIILPKDQEGNDILNVVGYEILRGTRKGNKSILAKGMINNFKDYNILGSPAGQGKVGLYANHPYNCIIPPGNNLTNSGDHDYLYNDAFIKKVDNNDNVLNQNIPLELVTFTSPDTSFRNPNLSVTELKLYGYLKGTAETRFIEPDKHPTNKLVSDGALFYMVIGGLINALLSTGGKKQINYPQGGYTGQHEIEQDLDLTMTPGSFTITPGPGGGGTSGTNGTLNTTNVVDNTNNQAGIDVTTANNTWTASWNSAFTTGTFILDSLTGQNNAADIFINHNEDALTARATYTPIVYQSELTGYQQLPPTLAAIGGAQQWLYYFSEGVQLTLDVIYALLPFRQYALQLISHGLYRLFYKPVPNQLRRFRVETGFYLYDSLQDVPEYLDSGFNPVRYVINNLKRTKTVVIRTSSASTGNTSVGPHLLLNPNGYSIDESQASIGMLEDLGYNINFDNEITNQVDLVIASHYAGLKYRLRNQYGLINSIIQLPITDCEFKFNPNIIPETTVSSFCNYLLKQRFVPSTDLLFKGDTYITRFTEKNTMLFFYNWLYDLPNGTEYNYFLYQMLPQARYWMNSSKYDATWINFNPTNIANLINYFTGPSFGTGFLPTDFYKLDNRNYNRDTDTTLNYPPTFGPGIKESFFYLASSGVRDFFVESDVITDFRNPGTFDYQRPYIPFKYTDLAFLFNIDPTRITKGNYYAYDYSLSINNMFNQFTTYAAVQDTTYDPLVSKLCYVYFPNRVIYSLPQEQLSSEDAWFLYLPLNYTQFKNNINSIKPFARTGMFITFTNGSPIIYQGVDQLQLTSGTKVTLGDAGLFEQAPQNIVISENSYEYGSAQNRLGVISTPAGLYYISQNQGKIFTYSDGLTEISQNGLKWWFNYFLPYKLTQKFPNYPHTDNPVAGIGCQAIYDNKNSIVYFSKKDYAVNPEYDNDDFIYDEINNIFLYRRTPVRLGQAPYFQDASWTVSYDPKNRYWVSYHDWHPNLTLASKNVFLSVKGNTVWKHDASYTDFCNFYGTPYPFEIEMPIVSGQTVNTLRSVEYILECYKRSETNPVDQFHVLDHNFDTAVVFNSEQVSGYLNLNIFPKNNITLSLQYPKLNGNLSSFDILFSKEEQKYRFNQFWDITKDRGEFPIGAGYPPSGPLIPGTTVLLGNYNELVPWDTSQNGYIKTLNQNNLDYIKPLLQRKKFRHYTNFLFLRKDPVTDLEERKVNMILKLVNTKNQISLR